MSLTTTHQYLIPRYCRVLHADEIVHIQLNKRLRHTREIVICDDPTDRRLFEFVKQDKAKIFPCGGERAEVKCLINMLLPTLLDHQLEYGR